MTVACPTIPDVLISRGRLDNGIAVFVRRALNGLGIEAGDITHAQYQEASLRVIRLKVAGCSAFVVILTPSMLRSPNVAFEIGMALAWNKPIFVLYDGIAKSDIPSYLREFHVASVSKLSHVIREIKKLPQPLSDGDRETLADVYCDLGVPTDQLLGQPVRVRELADEFNKRTKSTVGGEKLVQELIRLRKQGKLPKLKRR